MPRVYATFNIRNEFVAFWKKDEDSLGFFLPERMYEKYVNGSLKEWADMRASYTGRENDLAQYEDTVNAAWQLLSLGDLIDRSKVVVSDVEPGKFYPRIWRGRYEPGHLSGYNPIHPGRIYGYSHIQSTVAASSLFDYLVDIFRSVEPAKENYQSFGHKIRELLILCCTEIESSWRNVLEENSKHRKGRYSTVDYYRVKEPLRLAQWCVVLKDYPNVDSFVPFRTWDANSPTKSLQWYDSYNAVKHHREAEFGKANLYNLLAAMAALHIMQAAQWGPELYSLFHGNRFSPFAVVEHPTYGANEIYIPSLDGRGTFEPALYFDR